MENQEIILPILVLAFGVSVKLVTNRDVNIPKSLESILELPVDIMILSISFAAGHVIIKGKESDGLIFCFLFTIMTLACATLWRFAHSGYLKKKHWQWMLCLALSMSISINMLFRSVNLLIKNEIEVNEDIISRSDKIIDIDSIIIQDVDTSALPKK